MFDRTVNVEQGLLQGIAAANPYITVYRGIPYAKPPVGELRWRAPQPPEPWEGVRMADTFGAMPPQIEMHYGGQENAAPRNVSEDCLYLNIWTPAKSGDDRLGVMVWYHGGGYQTGSAVDLIFDGQRLAEKGIIIVTVGYRLGVLGYYCHPDMERESPYGTAGNFGLMDQAFALGWVHRNIASFGGDPEKITIAGQSAGAASVCNLMCSPLASGLFRQAICQSGDGLMRMEMEYARALKLGKQLSDALGDGSLRSMRNLSASDLVRSDYDAAREVTGAMFTPVTDHVVLRPMAEALLHGTLNTRVPMIFGTNREEGLGGEDIESALNAFGEDRSLVEREFPYRNEQERRVATARLGNELWYARDIFWARHREQALGMPTWHYQFCRPASINGHEIGAVHSVEMPFLFESYYQFGVFDVKPGDPVIASNLATYWANFVANGDPNGPGLAPWPSKGDAPDKHMCFDARIGMAEDIYDERIAAEVRFWEKSLLHKSCIKSSFDKLEEMT